MNRAKFINSLVDDVLDGEALKVSPSRHRAACDFIDDEGVEMWLDGEDLAILLTGSSEAQDRVRDRLRKRLGEKVRAWLEGPGADYVTERLQEIEEDARAEAAERRADARAHA